MCVGLSAKVVKISNGTAVVDAGGAKREVSAQLLEDLEPGDYVMVHAGVAIAKITEEDDSETEHHTREESSHVHTCASACSIAYFTHNGMRPHFAETY